MSEEEFEVGDIIRRIRPTRFSQFFGEVGEEYKVLNVDNLGRPMVVSGCGSADKEDFRLVRKFYEREREKTEMDLSNPNKVFWKDMSREEKGAMLLAYQEGKDIEYWSQISSKWKVTPPKPGWIKDCVYRVKPEPKVETVCLYSERLNGFSKTRFVFDNHKISFETVDGKPDWSTLKGEDL